MKKLLNAFHHIGVGLHNREPFLHIGYLGAAVVEGHGIYALMAGALAVCVLLGLLVGEH